MQQWMYKRSTAISNYGDISTWDTKKVRLPKATKPDVMGEGVVARHCTARRIMVGPISASSVARTLTPVASAWLRSRRQPQPHAIPPTHSLV